MFEEWTVDLTILNPIAGVNSLRTIGMEERKSSSYQRFMGWFKSSFEVIPESLDYSVFQYTISGEGILKHGNSLYRVPAGSAFVCNSIDEDVSYFFPAEVTEPWKFIYVEMSGHQIKSVISHMQKYQEPVIRFSNEPTVVARLKSFSRFNNRNCLLPISESNAIVSSIEQLLIGNIEEDISLPSGDIVSAARTELNRSLEQPITVSELADRLNVSREHLSRTFTKLIGISPHRFILNQKVSFACKLLRSSNLSCKEISARLGFSSQTLFSENFKRLKGLSPRMYRKLLK